MGLGGQPHHSPRLQATPTRVIICALGRSRLRVARNGGWRLQTARHTVGLQARGRLSAVCRAGCQPSGSSPLRGAMRPAESRVGSPGGRASSHRDIWFPPASSTGAQSVTPEPPASAVSPHPEGPRGSGGCLI